MQLKEIRPTTPSSSVISSTVAPAAQSFSQNMGSRKKWWMIIVILVVLAGSLWLGNFFKTKNNTVTDTGIVPVGNLKAIPAGFPVEVLLENNPHVLESSQVKNPDNIKFTVLYGSAKTPGENLAAVSNKFNAQMNTWGRLNFSPTADKLSVTYGNSKNILEYEFYIQQPQNRSVVSISLFTNTK